MRLHHANPEPSPRFREGVETGRAVPKGRKTDGKGTVQTTNAPWAAAKAEVVRILGPWVRIPPWTPSSIFTQIFQLVFLASAVAFIRARSSALEGRLP